MILEVSCRLMNQKVLHCVGGSGGTACPAPLSFPTPCETTIVASKACDVVLDGLSDQSLRQFAQNPEMHQAECFVEEAKSSHEIVVSNSVEMKSEAKSEEKASFLRRLNRYCSC